TRGLVLLGDRHDETEVRLDEGALGPLALTGGAAQFTLAGRGHALGRGLEFLTSLVAGLDGLSQTYFVVLREQWVLADVGEVQTDEVLLVPLHTILRHCSPFPDRRMRC